MSELEIVTVPVILPSVTSCVNREYSSCVVPALEMTLLNTIRRSSRTGIVSHGENLGRGSPGPPPWPSPPPPNPRLLPLSAMTSIFPPTHEI